MVERWHGEVHPVQEKLPNQPNRFVVDAKGAGEYKEEGKRKELDKEGNLVPPPPPPLTSLPQPSQTPLLEPPPGGGV